ncbi:unnamed protein product [Dibothriocephalus latus]|uniref:Thiopurine S-methyltransferase n=1 Tax=Dibothriocephalus latus TaxID=60516 RepID=A0A3P7QX30_DIBLA|nr:unnamed protein product [Dibothriocephalus latus]
MYSDVNRMLLFILICSRKKNKFVLAFRRIFHVREPAKRRFHSQRILSFFRKGRGVEYWDKLHPTDDFTHIYVPLCGKTVDMRWLYERGVNVVGNDLAEEAAVEFVKEHPQLAMSRTEVTLKNGEQTVVYEVIHNPMPTLAVPVV